MKRKLINLVAVLTLALVVIGALGGCKTNSSGWPIIWFLNNGVPVTHPPKTKPAPPVEPTSGIYFTNQ